MDFEMTHMPHDVYRWIWKLLAGAVWQDLVAMAAGEEAEAGLVEAR